MAITYDPKKLLAQIAPDAKIKRMVTKTLDPRKAALSFVSDVPFIDKKQVTEVALKTLKSYRKRVEAESGPDAKDLEKDLAKNPMQLIQRVQNDLIFQVSQEIKSTYRGEQYEWLPSDAEEPDPEHQLNYGKIFVVGEGEMPGERIGCKCGMRILVNETELDLG